MQLILKTALFVAFAMLGTAASAEAKFTVQFADGAQTVSAADICRAGVLPLTSGNQSVTFEVANGIILQNGRMTGAKCSSAVRGTGGGGSAGSSSTVTRNTPQDIVDETFGNKPGVDQVTYTNDTTTAIAGSGGQQQPGDEVPSRTVEQTALGGQPAGSGSGSPGQADSGVTENGNVAPSFD